MPATWGDPGPGGLGKQMLLSGPVSGGVGGGGRWLRAELSAGAGGPRSGGPRLRLRTAAASFAAPLPPRAPNCQQDEEKKERKKGAVKPSSAKSHFEINESRAVTVEETHPLPVGPGGERTHWKAPAPRPRSAPLPLGGREYWGFPPFRRIGGRGGAAVPQPRAACPDVATPREARRAAPGALTRDAAAPRALVSVSFGAGLRG